MSKSQNRHIWRESLYCLKLVWRADGSSPTSLLLEPTDGLRFQRCGLYFEFLKGVKTVHSHLSGLF